MKFALVLVAGAAALTLTACDRSGAPLLNPPAMKTVSKLNCPDSQGDLQRVSTAQDGRSCVYTDNDGGEVTLQLVNTNGSPEAALQPIEASLAKLVPTLAEVPAPAQPAVPAKPVSAAEASALARDAAAAQASAKADAGRAASAADHGEDADEAMNDLGSDTDVDEDVEVNLPGMHVTTHGQKAEVKVLGLHVNVDDSTDTAHVRREPRSGVGNRLAVDANENGAVVRVVGGNRVNLKSRVVYAMENPGPQGDYTVGYVARGPRTGPLVVATVRVKREDKGDIFDDVSRLARKAMRG